MKRKGGKMKGRKKKKGKERGRRGEEEEKGAL